MDCIYVVHGRDGLIKVGRSGNFKRRLASLKQEFKRYGDELIAYANFDLFDDHQALIAEMRLLDKLRGHLEPYAGREWFKGDAAKAIYAAAVTAHEELFRKPRHRHVPLPPGESERLRLLRAKEREDRKLAHIAFMEKRKAETQARRDLRELRRREIAEREAIRLGLIQQAA